jgi:hypothetical protein
MARAASRRDGQAPRTVTSPERCGHCGKILSGAYARHGEVKLCYPDDPSLPACYRRVKGGEALGELKGIRPLPPGAQGSIRERAPALSAPPG